MAGATITTLDSILKDLYIGPVVEQLNNEVLLLSRIDASDQELVGRQAIIPVHTSRTGGIGPAAESGALPAAGNQQYAKAVYNLKYLYGIVQVTGPSMVRTKSDAGAFLRALESELDGLRNDLKKDLARQVYGDGTGVIGTVSSYSNPTITLTSAEPILKGQFYAGQQVNVLTAALTAARTNTTTVFTIQSVNAATPSITLDRDATSTVATDVIVRVGAHTTSAGAFSAVNNEIDAGLQALVSATPTNTVGAIDRSVGANAYWKNQTQSLATFNLDNLQKAWGAVRVAGGETSLMIGSFGVQRQYYGMLQSQVRFNQPMTLQSGFQTLDFMGKPMVADLEAPFGKLYFLDERFIKVFSDMDWHFLDEDGLSLKWVSGIDAWQSILARYMNLGITRGNAQLVGTSITDTTGV